MVGHKYATVAGYITVGGRIVQAVKVDNPRIALTGVVTTIAPEDWPRVDSLEGGYDRVRVTTTDNEEVWMYAEPDWEARSRKQEEDSSDNQSERVADTTTSE